MPAATDPITEFCDRLEAATAAINNLDATLTARAPTPEIEQALAAVIAANTAVLEAVGPELFGLIRADVASAMAEAKANLIRH
jgi:hypothetical protein